MIFWGENVQVCQMTKSDFCIDVEIKGDGFEDKCWVVFIYASTDVNIRKKQWEVLKEKRKAWGKRWVRGEEEVISTT